MMAVFVISRFLTSWSILVLHSIKKITVCYTEALYIWKLSSTCLVKIMNKWIKPTLDQTVASVTKCTERSVKLWFKIWLVFCGVYSLFPLFNNWIIETKYDFISMQYVTLFNCCGALAYASINSSKIIFNYIMFTTTDIHIRCIHSMLWPIHI